MEAHQLSLFHVSTSGSVAPAAQPAPPAAQPVFITPEEIFAAYFECRRNKRNTINALAFERNYEANLSQLLADINSGAYRVGRSVAFIVFKPVKREIFCADFRDRVVHHLVVAKLNPLFEKLFIADSYSCRKGKGTLYGIRRVARFLRSCSRGYTRDCYVMKMDIEGYFMNMDRVLLSRRVSAFVERKYHGADKHIVLDLCRKIILNNPTENCYVKGRADNWEGLPLRKSLLKMKQQGVGINRGQPIGNLTSQVFSNFYLHPFDHFMKHTLKLKYYGRYVDDIVVVHERRAYLLEVRCRATAFLERELGLRMHPNKNYLQHYTKGVAFLGAHIAPHRTTMGRRIKGNLHEKITQWNAVIRTQRGKLSREQLDTFRSQLNSYLGFMHHHHSYRLRRRVAGKLSAWFANYVEMANSYRKVAYRDRGMKNG